MYKNTTSIVGAAVTLTLLCSPALGSVSPEGTSGPQASSDQSQAAPLGKATHTVFAEYGTATWCGYCKYAHGALKEIWAEGLYDFFYVSLVDDKDLWAKNRVRNDYNIYGFPTVFFDGGYDVRVGAGSVPTAKAAYEAAINNCGARDVPDIEAQLSVVWLGNATMDIQLSIVNNEAYDYEGYLRVYVTENESTLGWYDTWGYPYTFPLLDYAFNEDLTIPAGGTWEGAVIWNGNDYDNGYGVNFGGITMDNTTVIAAVFNDEWHQGYAYPPYNNPFDAYYVDETTGKMPSIPGDANQDGVVDIDDIFAILFAWGECDGCPEDVDGSGVVDIDDVFFVLDNWS
ncbi:MAG: hypothetical protein JSV91_11160 [Phycisphaerales bacterium]|nr:MAG: hypothetical protein JSV91_11160 [Phycisphaerales bacterium]